jgi:hypothetical protein
MVDRNACEQRAQMLGIGGELNVDLVGVAGQHGVNERGHGGNDASDVALDEEAAHIVGKMACVEDDLAVGRPLGQSDRHVQVVLLAWGAANRDPRQFEGPDVFRAERNPTGHVAFGSGVHLCLGAQLARMQGQAVLREIVDKAERIDVVGTPAWTTNPNLRGLTRMDVRLTPRLPAA